MNKILMSYFLLSFILITFMVSYYILKDITTLNSEIDANISNLSMSLAQDKQISDLVIDNSFDDFSYRYLDSLTKQIPKIDLIVICNKDDIRLYHTDHTKINKHFSGGDEISILTKGEHYLTDEKGTAARQRRSFSAIKDDENNIVGFVMVSAYTASISDVQSKILFNGFIIFIIAVIISFFFAFIISRNIKNTLLGYEPRNFTKMYIEKKEVLDSLEEGIIGLDTNGRCIVYNSAVISMISEDNNDYPSEVINDFIKNKLSKSINLFNLEYNKEININDTTILVNTIPIYEKNSIFGSVSIFRDKTEVTRLAEELTGVNHIIEALRANTHEQMNKLHVILGLLQIGDTDKAINYISDVTKDHEKNYSLIMNKIQNRTLAALLIGKINRAKELEIDFKVQSTSFIKNHDDFLSTNDLVTITGNLIENAFDALKYIDSIREVNFYIHSDDNCLTIIADDTGCGITKENMNKIFSRGFSTKGDNRGIGLYLIYNIVQKCNGTIDIESDPGIGTSITIIINKKRKRMKG